MSAGPKTVCVTGAAGNLGKAVAGAFAAVGSSLILVDLDAARLEREFADIGTGSRTLALDLLDARATRAALEAAAEAAGGIDALCCIAGGFHMGERVHETPTKAWELMRRLNVETMLNTTAAVIPGMLARGSGKIVTVGANAAQRGVPEMGAYTASKATVMRLTEAMSGELRDQGINVNCVLPSIIDTPENREGMPDADPAAWVAPDDLAKVVRFLCSAEARAVHGALIPVVGLS